MLGFIHFNFDGISFWLGFLIASLFWWAISNVKRLFPKIGASVKESIQTNRVRQQSGIEKYLLNNTFIKVQSLHVSKDLFSLEEIVIPPKLNVPTYLTPDDEASAITSIASHVIPYLPDTPELAAQYFVSNLTPAESLSEGANIVIIGEAGSGKTVALAYAAMQIFKEDPKCNKILDHLPLYIHISELDLSKLDSHDPIGLIIDFLVRENSSFVRSRIPESIRALAKQGKLIILVDGLDELPKESFDKAVAFLENLLTAFPNLQFMATASPNYLGGLIKLGFQPLSIACWSNREVNLFVETWNSMWIQQINNTYLNSNAADTVDPRIMTNWMTSQNLYISPLEWTLKIWAAYSGDLNGPLAINAIDNYLSRITGKIIPRTMLEHLALEFIKSSSASLPISRVDDFIFNYSLPINKTSPARKDGSESPSLPLQRDIHADDASISGRTSQSLIDAGLFVKFGNDAIQFINPVITGFLASFAIDEDQLNAIVHPFEWSASLSMLRYLSAQGRCADWINQHLITTSKAPLHRNITTAGKWISDAPVTSEWRIDLMRKLLGLVAVDPLPFPVKARLMSLYISSNDSSVSKLLKQLFSTNSVQLKILAALASGAMQDVKQGRDLANMLTDLNQDIRNAASLAIGALTQSTNIEPIIDLLMNGDDQVRQGAAETLVFFPGRGHEVLKEAISYDDLMVRKAAVFGLAQIKDKWAFDLLEKTSYEDKQWIVRNAAHQAVELSTKPNPFIPKPLPAPSEVKWLLEFASKKGVGITRGEFPRDILLSCLTEGTLDEKVDSLSYLVRYPDFETVYAIYKLVDMGDKTISEASINALWQISASGFELPDYKTK